MLSAFTRGIQVRLIRIFSIGAERLTDMALVAREERKVESVSLVLFVVLGLISFVAYPQGGRVVEHLQEVSLILAVIWLNRLAARLVWARWSRGCRGWRPTYSPTTRFAGAVLLILAPVADIAFWYYAIRIPIEAQADVRRGDAASRDNDYQRALDQYQQADMIAPGRIRIKGRVKETERKLREIERSGRATSLQ